MKDKNDIFTIDPFLVKRRGRPKSPDSKTPAEYKALQRRRDFENFLTGNTPIFDIPTTSLCDFLSRFVTSGATEKAQLICTELLARSLKNKP